MSFYPPDTQDGVDRKSQIVSSLVGPIAGHCVLAFGVLWWIWDLYLLPRLGYYFETEEKKEYDDRWGAEILDVHYIVSTTLSLKAFSIHLGTPRAETVYRDT